MRVICLSDVCLRCVLDVCGLGDVLRGGLEKFLKAPSAISFSVSLESDFSIKYAWGALARNQVQ